METRLRNGEARAAAATLVSAAAEGFGDQCRAATAQPSGLLSCGSEPLWFVTVCDGFDDSAKMSSVAGKNALMSCGPRLVTRLRSRTTSRSSQVAPAFTRSSRMPGHEVRVRPVSNPADASTHGPWHNVPIGLPA